MSEQKIARIASEWVLARQLERELRADYRSQRCEFFEPWENDTGSPGVQRCYSNDPHRLADTSEWCEGCQTRHTKWLAYLDARSSRRRIQRRLENQPIDESSHV